MTGDTRSWGGHHLGASNGERRPSPRPRIAVCPCVWTEGSMQLEHSTRVCGGHLTLQSLVSSSPCVEWFPVSLPAGGILLGARVRHMLPGSPSSLASCGGSACLGLWVHSVPSLSGRSVAYLEQFEQFPNVCTCAHEPQPQASSAGAHVPEAGRSWCGRRCWRTSRGLLGVPVCPQGHPAPTTLGTVLVKTPPPPA